VKSLTARSEFRLRVGDFRVLFEIRDDIVLVLIVAVRKREDAY
jgi:mRNA-degrading endonuclease RelE of RelBE toxin-antitoxin system